MWRNMFPTFLWKVHAGRHTSATNRFCTEGAWGDDVSCVGDMSVSELLAKWCNF